MRREARLTPLLSKMSFLMLTWTRWAGKIVERFPVVPAGGVSEPELHLGQGWPWPGATLAWTLATVVDSDDTMV